MKVWIVWLYGVLSLSAGCASHQVRCDGRLQPINASATAPGTVRDGAQPRGSR
jgi:hypothetical protein